MSPRPFHNHTDKSPFLDPLFTKPYHMHEALGWFVGDIMLCWSKFLKYCWPVEAGRQTALLPCSFCDNHLYHLYCVFWGVWGRLHRSYHHHSSTLRLLSGVGQMMTGISLFLFSVCSVADRFKHCVFNICH